MPEDIFNLRITTEGKVHFLVPGPSNPDRDLQFAVMVALTVLEVLHPEYQETLRMAREGQITSEDAAYRVIGMIVDPFQTEVKDLVARPPRPCAKVELPFGLQDLAQNRLGKFFQN